MKRSFASAHKRLLQLGSALSLGLGCSLAQAQEPAYPSGPLEMIVPFAPGGPVDALARTFARALELRAKHTVIVQSRPGGSFVVAMSAVNLAPANGHSFYFGPVTPITVHPHWMKTLPFKKDGFIPVCQTFENTFFLVGSPSLPHQDFAQLLAFAKANPGKLSYGSTGTMTSPHLTMELIAQQLGLELLHVPYKGSADLMQSILGGQIMAAADSTGFAPQVEAGKLRVLNTWGAERLAKFPDAPTLKELGLNLVQNSPFGIGAPKGTPDAVVKRLHDAFKQAMEQDSYKTALARYDMVPMYMSTSAYKKFAQDTFTREKALVEKLGLAKPS